MNWKAWFARDGVIWQVFFYGGLVAAGLSVAPQSILDTFPAWVSSAMPTVRLIAFIAMIIGGKNGMSPVPLARNLEGK